MHRAVLALLFSNLIIQAQSPQYKWLRQLGGLGTDTVVGIGLDAAGNTYVAGNTDSPDFPTLNALQPRAGGATFYRLDVASGATTALNGLTPGTAYSFAVDPRDPHTLYAATSGGVAVSHDSGLTWVFSDPPSGVQIGTVAIGLDGAVYGSAFAQGFYRVEGKNWTLLNAAVSVDHLAVDPNNPSVIYGRSRGTFARSEDGGVTWTLSTDTIVSSFSVIPKQPGTLVAAGDTSYRSTDYGKSWVKQGNFPNQYVFAPAVLADPVVTDRIAVLSSYGVYLTLDGGLTWKNTGFGASGGTVDTASGIFYFQTDAITGHLQLVSTRDFVTYTPVGPANLPAAFSVQTAGGQIYVTAGTYSDVVIVKLDGDGSTVYSTYLGGSSQDKLAAMAVDAAGAVYLTGETTSEDFPVTPGAYSAAHTQNARTFVVKLNPDGTLGWSTYFAGSAVATHPAAIAVDGTGSVYIAGTTSNGLPVTDGVYQHDFDGRFPMGGIVPLPQPTNAFLSRFSADGSRLIFSTYLGKQVDVATALTLGQDGSPYFGGGGKIWHMSPDGAQLLQTGTVASGGPVALATGPDANVYAVNPLIQLDVLSPSLAHVRSSQYGGLHKGTASDVAVDSVGRVLVVGSTVDRGFPTRAPLQGAFAPSTGFLSELSPDLSAPIFSSYVGDERLFTVNSVAESREGDLVFAGSTGPGYTYYARGGYATAPLSPGPDMFVAKLTPAIPAVRLDSIVNAAGYLANPLAVGEVVVVQGDGFGASPRLLLEGKPAEILYSSGQALSAIVPFGIPTTGSVHARVMAGDVASNEVAMPVRAASPGVYAVLNADGTRNSSDNPTSEGAVITVLVNGASSASQPVNVYVDGFYANGIDAKVGPVDGLGGSVYQVRVYVPKPSEMADRNPNLKDFKMPPVVPVLVEMGDVVSQGSVVVYVR